MGKKGNGMENVQKGVSTSLLRGTVTKEITGESFENASSETFATEQVFDLVSQWVFASFRYFAAFLVETWW